MGCTWQEVAVVIHTNMLVSTQDDPWSAPAHFFQPHWAMLQHVHHDGSLMDLRIQLSLKTQLQHQTCGNKSAKKTSQASLQNTLTLTMTLQSTLNLTLTFQNTLTLQETQTLTP